MLRVGFHFGEIRHGEEGRGRERTRRFKESSCRFVECASVLTIAAVPGVPAMRAMIPMWSSFSCKAKQKVEGRVIEKAS